MALSTNEILQIFKHHCFSVINLFFPDLPGRRSLSDGRPAAPLPLDGAVLRQLLPRGGRHQGDCPQDKENGKIARGAGLSS